MKTTRYQKGFSLPSVIIGSIIAALLSGVAISSMWGSVKNSKITTIASILKEQVTVFESQPDYDYQALNTNNDQDIFPELVVAGILSPIPNVFTEPTALKWEIRMVTLNGYRNIFYSTISSTNPDDQQLIDSAIAKLNLNSSRVKVD